MARQAMWVDGHAVVPRYVGGSGSGSPGTPGHELYGLEEATSGNGVVPTAQQGQGLGFIVFGSDWNGLREDNGVTFEGPQGRTNVFYASIPTPCWRLDDAGEHRAQLAMVGVLFTADENVTITNITAFDGPNGEIPIGFTTGVTGQHPTLEEGFTRFDLQSPQPVGFGITVKISVTFNGQGRITFHAVGADFLV